MSEHDDEKRTVESRGLPSIPREVVRKKSSQYRPAGTGALRRKARGGAKKTAKGGKKR